MSDHASSFALAAGLGAVAGLRSFAAPALLSRRLSGAAGDGFAARLLGRRGAAPLLAALAAGEIAADKTPWIPDRTEPPALAGRMLMGALCGAAVAGRRGGSTVGAALVGAAAAAAATFAGYHVRRAAGEATGLPDAVFAVAEDALVLAAGTRLADAV